MQGGSSGESSEGADPRLERWWEEHSRLDALVGALTASLGGDSTPAETRRCLVDLRQALETHLELEDRMYFPLVEQLAPDRVGTLREAQRGHQLLVAGLDEVGSEVERGAKERALVLLAQILESFRRHEELETRLIQQLGALGS